MSVESGFYANRVLMFEKQQKSIAEKHFRQYSMLTAMLLNHSLLHRFSEPAERPNDPRVLALLEAAYDRIAAPHGLASKSQSKVERLLRKSLRAE